MIKEEMAEALTQERFDELAYMRDGGVICSPSSSNAYRFSPGTRHLETAHIYKNGELGDWINALGDALAKFNDWQPYKSPEKRHVEGWLAIHYDGTVIFYKEKPLRLIVAETLIPIDQEYTVGSQPNGGDNA